MGLRAFIAAALICACPMASYGQTVQPVQGTGKAGSPATGVVSVQGVANGTPMPVTGTLSVAGTADTVGASATFNGNSICATVNVTGQNGVGFFLNSGTLDGTLTPYYSQDATVSNPNCDASSGNWTASQFIDGSGNTASTKVLTNPNAFVHLGVRTIGGTRCAKVCTTTLNSGSASGWLTATQGVSTLAPSADVTDRAGRLLGHVTVDAAPTTAITAAALPLPANAAKETGGNLDSLVAKDFATQTTLAAIKAKTDNLDVALSTRTKPADSQTVAGTVTANAGSGTFTNQQSNKTADYDTGAGTDTVTMFGVALPKSGGAVAGGTSTDPLRVDPTGGTTQPVSGTVSAAQSGTWTVQPGNTANTTAWKVDGSAVTQPVSGTVTANIGSSGSLALDATVSGLEVAQGSTTSGQNGPLAQGATTTAAPTYTTAKTNPLSLQTDGSLRTHETGTATVSGTVAIGAGSAVIGHVIADTGSTTAVTGNVTVTQGTGTNLHAVLDSGTTAVTQGTGTNLHAVIDSGSTTAVTGNVTVVQGTGTNLHAVLDTTSTTAVTQATGTNLHAVIDSGSTTAATQSGTWTVQPGNTQNTTPWSTAVLDQTVAATALSASCSSTGSCGGTTAISLPITGLQTAEVIITAVSSPLGFTVVCDTSFDGGTTYQLGKCIFEKSDAASTGTTKAALANGDLAAATAWQLQWNGAPSNVRVRVSAVTSGNFTAALRAVFAPPLPSWIGAAVANGIPINAAGSTLGLPMLAGDSATVTTGRLLRATPNDTSAISDGLETSPAVARASPTAVTAGRSERVQIGTTGSAFVDLQHVAGNAVTTIANGEQKVGVEGTVASGATAAGNPLGAGGRAATTIPTAVADTQRVEIMLDKFGRVVTTSQVDRALETHATVTLSASTAETTLLTQVASTFLDLTAISCNNNSTTASRIDVRDTTGGSVKFSLSCPAAIGPCEGYVFQVPLPQTTVNTNWTVQSSASATDYRCFAQAVKNK